MTSSMEAMKRKEIFILRRATKHPICPSFVITFLADKAIMFGILAHSTTEEFREEALSELDIDRRYDMI